MRFMQLLDRTLLKNLKMSRKVKKFVKACVNSYKTIPTLI